MVLASRPSRLAARAIAGGSVLVALVVRAGTGPFLHGVLSIDVRAIGAALLLTAAATAAAAWRWRVVAARLGASLPWPAAVAMYYRSQFLNSVLPGGVLGDVERALARAGGRAGLAAAARAVVVERTAGQLVQVALAVVVVACSAAEFEGYLLAAVGAGLSLLALALAAAATSERARSAVVRELRTLATAVGSPAALVQVLAASIVVVACHVATFEVAAVAVGARVPPGRLAALALVVLLAASIPLNVGGWGAREGAAGWAFAVAGTGASAGIAASTLFGVLAFLAVLPGLVIVVASTARRGRTAVPVRALALAGARRKARP